MYVHAGEIIIKMIHMPWSQPIVCLSTSFFDALISQIYRRSWYFHSNILDSLTAWLAGVQPNPVFLFPPSQAMGESTFFE